MHVTTKHREEEGEECISENGMEMEALIILTTVGRELHEILLIVLAHTIVDPRTVMVHVEYAPTTNVTMVSPGRTVNVTTLAIGPLPIGHHHRGCLTKCWITEWIWVIACHSIPFRWKL